MEDRKQYQPLFPKEYDYLNVRYEKFQQVLSAIDYELDSGMTDKGPHPAPKPEGHVYTDPELRERRRNFLEKTRELRVMSFKNGLEKDIRAMEQQQLDMIYDRFDFETSRNGFKNYSKDDLKAVQDVDKGDEVSFDYMAAQHFDQFAIYRGGNVTERENIEGWTDRYLNMLDYRETLDSIDRNMDMTEIEPEI